MSRLSACMTAGLAALLCFGVVLTNAQAGKFSSLYTNLKTECRPAVKLKKGEEFQGDMPLKCKGYGGYEIRVGYSAMSSQFSINLVGKDEDVVVSTMQPLNYDLQRKVEWRFAKGKPFAVIYRIDLTKGTSADANMWSPENKTGESLVIKGLKGFEQIDFEIDARQPGANLKAREMADQAYARR
jgi:hypothetical protein